MSHNFIAFRIITQLLDNQLYRHTDFKVFKVTAGEVSQYPDLRQGYDAIGIRYLSHEELCWLLHDDTKAVYFTSWAKLAVLQTPMLAVNANPPFPFGEKDLSASRAPPANQRWFLIRG